MLTSSQSTRCAAPSTTRAALDAAGNTVRACQARAEPTNASHRSADRLEARERSGVAAKREGVKHSVAQKVTELRGRAHPQSVSALAQLAEQSSTQRWVAGSNPACTYKRKTFPVTAESAVNLDPARGIEAAESPQSDQLSVRR